MDVNLTVRVPALEKLTDYVASGIGSVAGSLLATWKARRMAEALQIQASAHASALSIIASAQRDARQQLDVFDVSMTSDLLIPEAIEQRIQFQEEKRQRNIHSVVTQAADFLGDEDVPDHELDHDWIAKFFGNIQDVSSPELQELWAKILAGEIERPNSTSIRTLGILKELNKEVATIFKILCSACVWVKMEDQVVDARVPSLGGHASSNSLIKYEIHFKNLNILNEYGLIIPTYDSRCDYRVCTGMIIEDTGQSIRLPLQHQKKYWILSRKDESTGPLNIEGVALSRSGIELAKVVSIDPIPEYTQDLISYFETINLEMVEAQNTDLPNFMPPLAPLRPVP